MKKTGVFLFGLIIGFFTYAQRISRPDFLFLKKNEDSLKTQSFKLAMGRNASDRFTADSIFTRMFVRSLKTTNSFYYPFDSLLNISKLYAPDSSFRIYTWQLMINENTIRQHGAIQMKTVDGSFKRFPLLDKSDITTSPADTVGSNEGWMGAVYYKIIQKNYDGQTFYTLLGFDENNIRSDKKVMEILQFINGKPVFGNPLFVIENSNSYKKNIARYILEYKKEATTRLTYDPDLDAVVFDELVSETGDAKKKWTLIPDGEYEGFKWKNGKWVYTKNLFSGTPTIKYSAPLPVRDVKGTINEGKLKGGEIPPELPN